MTLAAAIEQPRRPPLAGDGRGPMRVMIVTDAWRPQVNGVVRTLTSLARSAKGLGVDIEFLSPEGFRTVPLPTYPGLRLALPGRSRVARRIAAIAPDAIHLATEGPIGHAVRATMVSSVDIECQ